MEIPEEIQKKVREKDEAKGLGKVTGNHANFGQYLLGVLLVSNFPGEEKVDLVMAETLFLGEKIHVKKRSWSWSKAH